MAKKSAIHQLIHSLDASEKRYFKKYTTRSGKEKGKQYVQLFDAIGKQKEYDEAKLLRGFKGNSITNHFAVTKNYLYYTILDALKDLYKNGNHEIQLLNTFNQVIVLHRKGLYQQALKLNEKGLNLAKKNGMKYIEAHFLRYKMIIWRDSESLDKLTDDLDELWMDLDVSIAGYKDQMNLDYMNSKRLYTLRKGTSNNKTNKEFIAWTSRIKDMTEDNCYNPKDLSKYIQMRINLAEVEGNYEEMFRFARRGVKEELIDKKIPINTVIFYQNILTKSVRFMYYEEMPFYIQQIRNLSLIQGIKNQKLVASYANVRANGFELTYFYQTGNEESCLELIDSYSKDLLEYEHTDAYIWRAIINSLMSLYLWNYGKLSLSQDKINYLLNETNPSLVSPYQLLARFVFMAILFEQQSYRLLENLIEKTQRYLKKENIDTPICHKILTTFKKLYKAINKSERLKIINDFEVDSKEDRVHFDIFSGYRDFATILIRRMR